MIDTSRKVGVGNDNNLLLVIAKTVDLKHHIGPYGTGIAVQLAGYSINDVLSDLLEDYQAEVLIEKIKQINS